LPDGDLQEGLRAMKAAVQLEPQNQIFKINLANIQSHLKDYAGAKKTLQPLLSASANDGSGMKASAQAMLKAIERSEQYDANRIEITADSRSGKEPSAEETNKPKAPPHPYASLDGAEKMRGVITAVECKGTSMTITLKNDEKTAKFFVSDHNQIPFFSRAAEFSVDIVCGPNKIPAIIYFKLRVDRSLIAGDAVAVEFTK
jgi:hypothetical protein